MNEKKVRVTPKPENAAATIAGFKEVLKKVEDLKGKVDTVETVVAEMITANCPLDEVTSVRESLIRMIGTIELNNKTIRAFSEVFLEGREQLIEFGYGEALGLIGTMIEGLDGVHNKAMHTLARVDEHIKSRQVVS